MASVQRWAARLAVVAVAVLAAAQLVPYGRDHDNPPVVRDAPWPSDEARSLAVSACYDCHSHETKWPWYSNVAPMSWLVQRDVDNGRDELNFSNWPRSAEDKAAEVVADGEMPPRRYLLAHPQARLSEAEKRTLIDALSRFGEDD